MSSAIGSSDFQVLSLSTMEILSLILPTNEIHILKVTKQWNCLSLVTNEIRHQSLSANEILSQ